MIDKVSIKQRISAKIIHLFTRQKELHVTGVKVQMQVKKGVDTQMLQERAAHIEVMF